MAIGKKDNNDNKLESIFSSFSIRFEYVPKFSKKKKEKLDVMMPESVNLPKLLWMAIPILVDWIWLFAIGIEDYNKNI